MAANAEVNPAVAEIIDSHPRNAAPAAPTRPAGRPVRTRGLSMTPEAIRSRERRAAARSGPVPLTRPDGSRHEANNPITGPLERSADGPISPAPRLPDPVDRPTDRPTEPTAPADRFTPAHLQLMPDGPKRATVTPEQMDAAIRNWTMIVRAAGYIAAKVFNGDELKVPDEDARDCAEAILDGWPELALASDADFKKVMACVTVGSVGFQRWELHKAAKAKPAAAMPAPTPAASSPAAPAANAAPLQLVDATQW